MKAKYWPCLSVKLFSDIRHTLDSSADSAGPLTQKAKMNICYRVELSEAERAELQAMLSGGKQAARTLKRAQILLAADAGVPDEAIAESIAVGGSTVYRTKRRFVEGNLERALSEEPRPGAARKLSGPEEALLVATACAKPPAGRARWTLELLAGEIVRLTQHESLSREAVRRRLSENALKPWQQKMWCVPKIDGAYVARMEDVLDLYAEPSDPQHPVVCFDESPVQLIGETRQPLPATPGQIERVDYEYRRCGTVNLFVVLDAHRPWRRGEHEEVWGGFSNGPVERGSCQNEQRLVAVVYPLQISACRSTAPRNLMLPGRVLRANSSRGSPLNRQGRNRGRVWVQNAGSRRVSRKAERPDNLHRSLALITYAICLRCSGGEELVSDRDRRGSRARVRRPGPHG
jgi:transposase